jgi:hypothetical protein
MSSAYERFNLAQSISVGPNGRLIRLVSRIAMLTIEAPAAMKASDWPEQRRIRGDLDEAIARLAEFDNPDPAVNSEVESLLAAGRAMVSAIVTTPRGTPSAIEQARSASAEAVRAAEAITALLDQPGEPSVSLLDS